MRMVAFGGPAPSLPIYAPVLGVFDDALVAATAKFKCWVALGEYEWPIHEHVDVGEGLRQGRCFQNRLDGVSRVAPYIIWLDVAFEAL